jgi:hypothetical protein
MRKNLDIAVPVPVDQLESEPADLEDCDAIRCAWEASEVEKLDEGYRITLGEPKKTSIH